MLALIGTVPARAELGGEGAIASNDIFRGRSISAGRPVARMAVSYDDLAGPYIGGSASLIGRGGAAHLLAVQAFGGVAIRVRPELTLDFGAIHTDYTRYWSGGRRAHYTEFYAGLAGRRLSARGYVSPDYLRSGWKTFYGEVNAVIVADGNWEASAHGGVLLWIAGGRPTGANFAYYDWRIEAARRIGPVRISVGWAAGGPQRDVYAGRAHHHGVPTLGISGAF